MAAGMSSLRCNLSILLCSLVLTVLHYTSVEAAANNNNCGNSTGSTNSSDSCSEITYEQVYNLLTKSENSFNIESALYPAKKPSSVRVFVNVYGPGNRTENSVPAAKYTWSISCLYAGLPAKALEVWSLWSILVARRTQKLDITISFSCCDVTQGKLKDHIDGVLAALQDLAVSPGIRDPQLNSAECITEGHEIDIIATGHSGRIIAMLCCSFLFAVLSGPLLAFYILDLLKERKKKETKPSKKQKKAMKKTIDGLCVFLLVIFVALLFYKEFTMCKDDQKVPKYIHVIWPGIVVVGLCVGVCTCKWCPEEGSKLHYWNIPYITCANLTAFHFCWLLVGIMLNPTWGLVALLVVCLVIGVFSYALFTFLCVVVKTSSSNHVNNAASNATEGGDDGNHPCQAFFSCLSAFLAVCCLIVVVILAGQSYHGKQTADEVLKDAVLYLISICFSWLYLKNLASKPETSVSQTLVRELQSLTEARPEEEEANGITSSQEGDTGGL